MADYALLFYGYEEDDAVKINEKLKESLECDLDMFSASASSNPIVKNIITENEKSEFEKLQNCFLMFLGFENDMISKVLSTFPKDVKRPLFCGATENNVDWNVNYLMEHLLEEQKEMEEKKKKEQQ